ncbi:TlpA family protein disulfide reductase [Flavicella marina]|uniref:TlpA family protein disulfide reductase n=1 Tax=Flavicella marina TaxID=1475951 RepID=UPI001265A815|nr:TlpA disulfide reductase family protein [Flavicella marina]
MKKFIKKHWSNIVFVIAMGLVLHPTSKEVLLRTIALSPSLTDESVVLDNYQWQLRGVNTQDVLLSSAKGKVVFVNFWATWCPPCRAEMPAIQNLYNQYKDDVVFLFVTQENKNKVATFFENYGYDLPVYNSGSRVPIQLNTTNSIPATYVIDKRGNIVISKTGAAAWDSKDSFELFDQLIAQ